MTPGSFDHKTCRAMVGDARARAIESDARAVSDLREEILTDLQALKTLADWAATPTNPASASTEATLFTSPAN